MLRLNVVRENSITLLNWSRTTRSIPGCANSKNNSSNWNIYWISVCYLFPICFVFFNSCSTFWATFVLQIALDTEKLSNTSYLPSPFGVCPCHWNSLRSPILFVSLSQDIRSLKQQTRSVKGETTSVKELARTRVLTDVYAPLNVNNYLKNHSTCLLDGRHRLADVK